MENGEFSISFLTENFRNEHMHQEVEFLYVMEGEICLHLFNNKYVLRGEDFIIINSNHRHSYTMNVPSAICILHFNFRMMQEHLENTSFLIHCNSVLEEDERYRYIRDLMNQLLSECAINIDKMTFRKKSLIYDFLDYLIHNFSLDETVDWTDDHDPRLEKLLKYIYLNIGETVSLKEAADLLFMSPSSVSRYFKKATGLNFLDYVNQMRLHYALEALCYSDSPVTRIANECGFSNASAFCRIFRNAYGKSPVEYRNSFRKAGISDHTVSENKDIFRYLKKYKTQAAFRSSADHRKNTIVITCDSLNHTSWENPWTKALYLGNTCELLDSSLRSQIITAKKELNFTFGEIGSLFSEKMKARLAHERTISNYYYIDSVLDFLVNLNITPVISFDNKKELIMKDINHILYESKEEHPFESVEEMLSVLEDFLYHIVRRYGLKTVSGWSFDCWYHTFRKTFLGIRTDDFVGIFEKVCTLIKKVIPEAKVGGWGLSLTEGKEDHYLMEILDLWSRSRVIPDFVSLNLYPYMVTENEDSSLNFRRRINNAEYYNRIVTACRRRMDECGLGKIPIHIAEWNTSMSKRNYYNDTCGKAAHVLQMISELNINVEFAAYKELSDLSGIYLDNKQFLFGGWGLVNSYGAKKPVYYAIMFLNEMEPLLIYRDRFSIITTDTHGTYTILCFNASRLKYSYYMKRENEIPADQIDQIFEDEKLLDITFCLTNVENGHYNIKESRICHDYGDILHEWKKLGMNEFLDQEDHEYLSLISVPAKKHGHIMVEDNKIRFQLTLMKNEIRMIKLTASARFFSSLEPSLKDSSAMG